MTVSPFFHFIKHGGKAYVAFIILFSVGLPTSAYFNYRDVHILV